MRLFQEMFKNGRQLDGEIAPLPRCVILPDRGGYVEGVRSVGDFSSERLVLYFAKHSAEVEGEHFTIGKYCDGDLELLGEIVSLRFLQERKKEN